MNLGKLHSLVVAWGVIKMIKIMMMILTADVGIVMGMIIIRKCIKKMI